MIASVKQILHNANLFIWQISRDLEKFQGILRSLDGFAQVSTDLHKFRRICKSFNGFAKVSTDLQKCRRIWRSFHRFEKFRGIWRCFKGFQEVLRDFKKFLVISKSFDGFRKLSRDLEKFWGMFDNFIYPKMRNLLHFAFLNFILWKKFSKHIPLWRVTERTNIVEMQFSYP